MKIRPILLAAVLAAGCSQRHHVSTAFLRDALQSCVQEAAKRAASNQMYTVSGSQQDILTVPAHFHHEYVIDFRDSRTGAVSQCLADLRTTLPATATRSGSRVGAQNTLHWRYTMRYTDGEHTGTLEADATGGLSPTRVRVVVDEI